MELLQSLSGGLVAAAAVFIVAWLGKERYDARFEAIDARFDGVDARFEALHGEFRELKEYFRQMRTELATMRSDLTNVALEVGSRPRPQTG